MPVSTKLVGHSGIRHPSFDSATDIQTAGTDWEYPYLIVPFAAYLFYLSILWISPFLNGVLSYRRTNLAGKKYAAHFSPDEVRVSGEYIVWIHQWPSFTLMRESKSLFILYDGITMYIFAKRYFTTAQMEDLQQLLKRAQAEREHPQSQKN
jgi:YcxB-like protein